MDREILFRGKTIYKQWLEGYYLRSSEGKHYIFALGDTVTYAFTSQVNPATVGQFTGLYDVNKKRIFEGDVVLVRRHDTLIPTKVTIKDIRELPRAMFGSAVDALETIGTIHDNPELMEVKNVSAN